MKQVMTLVMSCTVLSLSAALQYIPFDKAMDVEQYPHVVASAENYRRMGQSGDNLLMFFKQLYQKNSFLRVMPGTMLKIPKIIHQIWIGERVPEKFKQFQHSWQCYHPDWEYRLWTQHDIPSLRLRNMDLVAASRNPGEISDIMRYEILERFGGVYVDMDFECLAPLDELHYCYDLYVGIQPLDSSLVQLGIGLIGAMPHHPVLVHAINTLRTSYFDPANQKNAPAKTGPIHFTKSFIACAGQHETKDIALPAFYCYPLACTQELLQHDLWRAQGAFGIHHWAKSWLLPQFRKQEFQQLDN